MDTPFGLILLFITGIVAGIYLGAGEMKRSYFRCAENGIAIEQCAKINGWGQPHSRSE